MLHYWCTCWLYFNMITLNLYFYRWWILAWGRRVWIHQTDPRNPVCLVGIVNSLSPHTSPWYNHHGWLGIKNQFPSVLSLPTPPPVFSVLCLSVRLLCALLTKPVFCRNKSLLVVKSFVAKKIPFVVTKYFCQDKTFVATNTCLWQQIFVVASIFLSQQKMYFVMTNPCLSRTTHVCHNKTFVHWQMHSVVCWQ